MPCLSELYTLFYPNGIKVIPENIYEILTPVALARGRQAPRFYLGPLSRSHIKTHIIMGDGIASRHGIVLCTNSFYFKDVVRLMNVLMIRYRLECTIHLKRGQSQKVEYLIYIREGSMALLRSIVIPYLHSSMYYKLRI